MEAALEHLFAEIHWTLLAFAIAVSLFVLGKGADWLVDEAVELSERLKIPQMVVGATIVSLGTTAPEAAVSVFAAIQGAPGLALGNAVGSVITDTGLILGLACLIAPLRLDPKIVNRQGWIQLGAGFLLVLLAIPLANPGDVFVSGGRVSQLSGFLLIALLAAYLYFSVRWARGGRATEEDDHEAGSPTWIPVLKLLGAVAIVVVSAQVLIPAVNEAALRLSVPESVIAATLVAFGTSLPELVTAITAARRGHGELAVGNVIGADILNVLFVVGMAAAVTPLGLEASTNFFTVLFPAMLFILIMFRVGVIVSGDVLRRPFGYLLITAYVVYMVAGYYLLPGGAPG
jgi:cation:H+ antiporter